jgi:hypothetical protein
MLWAQLGQSGGRGAHLLECLSRMHRAVLGPPLRAVGAVSIFGAASICWVVDRQPSLLRSCRQMNFWQCRISRHGSREAPNVQQIFSTPKCQSPTLNSLRNIRRSDQGEAFASFLDAEWKSMRKWVQMLPALDQACAWSAVLRSRRFRPVRPHCLGTDLLVHRD